MGGNGGKWEGSPPATADHSEEFRFEKESKKIVKERVLWCLWRGGGLCVLAGLCIQEFLLLPLLYFPFDSFVLSFVDWALACVWHVKPRPVFRGAGWTAEE